jgi:hypothetical protein
MSTPRNHHYVSQALSRNFLSEEGRLFKVSKSEKRIREVKSTKSLFSQRDLNSILDEDGEIDHKTVETILNQYFETNFPTHCRIILDALSTNCEVGKVVPNTENIQESMEYLLGMSLIGPFRHPQYMQETEQMIFGILNEIASNAVPELQNAIYYEMNRLSAVKNKVSVDFKELKKGIFELMGDIKYGVMRAPENHCFILPDCSAGTKRFQMPSDFIDGIEYINPSMPIGFALMPINSKVVITAVSRRLLPDEFRKQANGFYSMNEETMFDYNNILFDSAYNEVACENKEYLEGFINKIN